MRLRGMLTSWCRACATTELKLESLILAGAPSVVVTRMLLVSVASTSLVLTTSFVVL